MMGFCDIIHKIPIIEELVMSIVDQLLDYEHRLKEAATRAILTLFGYPNNVEIHIAQSATKTTFVKDNFEILCEIKVDATSHSINVSFRSNYPEILEALQNVTTH